MITVSGEVAKNRPRACGALIMGEAILMVRHQEGDRVFWTLPGGGVEAGETFEEAVVRETFEETGGQVRALQLLWSDVYGPGQSEERCYLLAFEGGQASLGCDPEEGHVPAEERQLQGVEWVPLEQVADDVQVSRVLRALRS